MYEVSSMVSVPCVMTTPSTPPSNRLLISVASSARSAKVRSPEETCRKATVSSSAVCSSAGTARTSSLAPRRGATPPAEAPASSVEAIVPPSENTLTRGI